MVGGGESEGWGWEGFFQVRDSNRWVVGGAMEEREASISHASGRKVKRSEG